MVDTIIIETESASVTEVLTDSVTTLETVTQGPQGAPGASGTMGDGIDDGDIIRWNAATETWEAKQEPFEFNGIVLTPQESAILETEGALYYSSTDKTLKLCIEE